MAGRGTRGRESHGPERWEQQRLLGSPDPSWRPIGHMGVEDRSPAPLGPKVLRPHPGHLPTLALPVRRPTAYKPLGSLYLHPLIHKARINSALQIRKLRQAEEKSQDPFQAPIPFWKVLEPRLGKVCPP